ncbi:Reverse transcriptase, RNA-dependent DNA-polymerase, partial [Sesbania bispinosa]
VVTSFGFKENASDQGIYLKTSGSHFVILVLYIDHILLASSSVELFTETKFMLNSHFDMKELMMPLLFWAFKFSVIGHVAFLDCLGEDILIIPQMV